MYPYMYNIEMYKDIQMCIYMHIYIYIYRYMQSVYMYTHISLGPEGVIYLDFGVGVCTRMAPGPLRTEGLLITFWVSGAL